MKCEARSCKSTGKILWTFQDGQKRVYCNPHSNKIKEEIWRHAEEMAKFKPSGMPELRQ